MAFFDVWSSQSSSTMLGGQKICGQLYIMCTTSIHRHLFLQLALASVPTFWYLLTTFWPPLLHVVTMSLSHESCGPCFFDMLGKYMVRIVWMYLVGNHCGDQSNLGDKKVFHPFIAVSDLWGSIVQVKYLGEEGAATPIGAAAAVCCPWDLVVCPCF